MVSETGVSATVDFTTRDPTVTQPTTSQVIDQHLEKFKGALVGHVTTQFLYQGQLLEKAIRDLEETRRDLVKYKEAFHDAEREKCDLEGRVKVLSEEIRQFRERGTHGREEGVEQRDPLTQGNGDSRKPGVVSAEPASIDTQQHVVMREGTPTA